MRKIYIDGLSLVDGHFSGVGHYVLGIVRGLDQLAAQAKLEQKPFPEIEVIIPYTTVERFRSFGFQYVSYRRFPMPFRVMSALHHRNLLPPIDLICGKGVYIFTRFATMPLAFSDSVVVIYDLSFELYREYAEDRNAKFLSAVVSKSISRSKRVIAISDNSRQEIMDFYGITPDKMILAKPSVDGRLFYKHSQPKIKEIKNKYKIEGDYILYVGNLEPRKNLDGLVEAYTKLPKDITDKYSLLLVGVTGWKTEALFSRIIDLYKKGFKIIRPASYVLDEDLPVIYSGAKMVVYPSHYEGFGMPPLEALSCGTPAITSNNSSMPEVVGEQGILIDDKNIDSITAAIKTVIDDSRIEKDTITNGPRQARKFSWSASAQAIVDGLEGLL